MADLTTQLTGTKKLQFIFVPTGKTYAATTTNAADEGKIVFREADKTIDVRGVTYGASTGDLANLGQALTALKEAGLMTETGGVYTKSTPITTEETGISLGEGVTTGTIKQFLHALQTEIQDLSSLKADKTEVVKKVNNVGITSGTNNVALDAAHVNVDDTAATPETVKAAIERLGTAIGATGTDNTLHLYQGATGTTAPSDGTIHADGSVYRLVQGSGAGTDASTGLIAKFDIERDSFVKEGKLVYGPADDGHDGPGLISGTAADLNEVASPDAANGKTTPYLKLVIKSDSTGEYYVYIKASDLVDVYTVPSSQSGPVTLSINNHTISAAFAINEKTVSGNATSTAPDPVSGVSKTTYVNVAKGVSVTTENGEVKTSGVGITDQAVDAAGAANAAYTEALGSNLDNPGDSTIWGANLAAAAAATAASNAATEAAKHTTAIGSGSNDGTASGNNYIVVTDTRANSTDAHAYTVKTTTALDTAITTAEQNAKDYADTICTWTVIGEGSGN